MRIILYILFLTVTVQSLAQHGEKSGVSEARQRLYQVSSFQQRPDTLKQSLDSLKIKQKADSVQGLIARNKQTVIKAGDSITQVINTPIQKVQDRVNATESKVQSGLDSLREKITQPAEKFHDAMDKTQHDAEVKVSTVTDKVTGKTDDLEKQTGEVQQQIQKVTDRDVKLPIKGMEIPDAGVDLPLKNIDTSVLPSTDVKLPDVPQASLPKADIDAKLPTDKTNLEKLTDKADIKLPNSEKLNNVTGKIDKVDNKLAVAEQYEKDLGNIKEGGLANTEKLPETLEEKVTNLDEVKPLNEELQKATRQQTEYEEAIQRYRNTKLLQAEIKRKAANVANDRIAKFAPEIEKATGQLAKTKKLAGQIKTTKSFFQKRQAELRAKKFHERLIPGVTTQFYRANQATTDWGLQLSYKFTTRLSAGAGAIYRTTFGKDNPYFISRAGVYGARALVEVDLIKGLFAHGEFESLRLRSYAFDLATENISNNVHGSYFGIGKRFNITRKIKGTVMGLYRVEYKGELPGISKMNMRMGFEYDLSKKVRIPGLK